MMKEGFRASMLWLHTWSGLVMGWLLFAVFLTGTIVFFRTEINHWMTPELHQSVPAEDSAQVALDYLLARAPAAEQWQISLPDARQRTLDVRWQNPGGPGGRRGPSATLDASTGEVLQPRETSGADFLYTFHFQLHAMPYLVGRAIIGIASMLMFIAIISGVILHKNIFRDFFSFRTRKSLRGFLDAHAITAVFALPFHLMITFSGLVLLAGTLVFWNNEPRQFRGGDAEAEILAPVPENASLPPVNRAVADAEAYWGQPVSAITLTHPLDDNGEIRLTPAYREKVSAGRGGGLARIYDFQGNLLSDDPGGQAGTNIEAFYNALVILHQGRFAETFLRWLFFIAGVLGTIMVGTGMVYWSQKRRKKQRGKFGFELVAAFNLAGIAGLCVATAAYFWANRLIPADVADRADWEIAAFFWVWLATLVHALFYRHRRGWVQQLGAAAVLFLLIPLVDSVGSDTNLISALIHGDWMRLGFDLVAMLTGTAFAATAVYLAKTAPSVNTVKAEQQQTARPSRTLEVEA